MADGVGPSAECEVQRRVPRGHDEDPGEAGPDPDEGAARDSGRAAAGTAQEGSHAETGAEHDGLPDPALPGSPPVIMIS